MRISEIDLQCEDIMWFATDSKGHIFACTSAGCGNVPEYICRRREETDILLEYFTTNAPLVTKPILLIPAEDNDLTADIINLSSKGIYCFDITDYDEDDVYNMISLPEKPINRSQLPANIQELLADHIYTGDVSVEKSISVEHAY